MHRNRPHITQRSAVGGGGISTRERQRDEDASHQSVGRPHISHSLKYAICNMSLEDWPFDRALAFARECGYTGFEIAPYTLAPQMKEISASKRAEVRRQTEQASLEVVGLHQVLSRTEGFQLTTRDAEVRQKTAAYLGELAQLCRDLGGSMLVLGSPQQRNRQPGVTTYEAMRNAAQVIHSAMPSLERHNIIVALEPLGPSETNFLTTTAEGVELMQMINSPHCRLVLDCKGMAGAGESVPDTLRKYHAQMVHFHANDPNRQGPGFGDLDFIPIMAALREIDWQGWVSVEAFDYSADIESAVRASIQNLKLAAN